MMPTIPHKDMVTEGMSKKIPKKDKKRRGVQWGERRETLLGQKKKEKSEVSTEEKKKIAPCSKPGWAHHRASANSAVWV